MLEARSSGGLVTANFVVTEHGTFVTNLNGRRSGGCEFALGGHQFSITPTSRKQYVLFGPSGEMARADRRGRTLWRAQTAAGPLELFRPSKWRTGWELSQDGRAIGTMIAEGGLRFHATAHLPAQMPITDRLFFFHIVLMAWVQEMQAQST
jgi:hypothetical protein